MALERSPDRPAPTKVHGDDVLAVGRELFAASGIDGGIAESWLSIAVRRDELGDFVRGMGRLPDVLDRVGSRELGMRLDAPAEKLTVLSARVWAPRRHWPDQVGQRAAALAAEMAGESGIGLVAFPKPHVVGAVLGPVLDAGMIGVVSVQNAPLMNHPGVASGNLVGNNPLAFCAPGDPPFLFDGAMSQNSLFGLLEHAKSGTLPEGAVLDEDGEPSRDPKVVEGLSGPERGGGSLVPLGGVKGLGLAMCAEFLAGALTGGFHDPPAGKPWGEGALVVAFSGKLFPSPRMTDRIRDYLVQFDSYPGLHAQSSVVNRTKGGIEYPEDVLRALDAASEQRGLAGRLVSN